MNSIRKLTVAGLLVALGVVCSTFSIPVGAAKCFPIQSMVNVLAGVLLGPGYAVGMAFSTSLLRVMLGTGSLLAFPGSMIGALCCGLLYQFTKKLPLAYLGEIIGTGVLGALAAYPVVTLIISKQAALFAYVIPFIASSFGGATISILLISALKKTRALDTMTSALNSK
jgi:energy coupling factor transporter S component ThiW